MCCLFCEKNVAYTFSVCFLWALYFGWQDWGSADLRSPEDLQAGASEIALPCPHFSWTFVWSLQKGSTRFWSKYDSSLGQEWSYDGNGHRFPHVLYACVCFLMCVFVPCVRPANFANMSVSLFLKSI